MTLPRRSFLAAGALPAALSLAPGLALWPSRAHAAVGQPAPDFTLTDTQGRPVRLSALRGKPVVLEWTNPSCPFVKKHYQGGAQGNMQTHQREALAAGAHWLTVNSTHDSSPDYLTPDALGRWMAEQKGSPTATLLDADGRVGAAYAARVTPHLFIVDAQGQLAYAGGIDSIAAARVEDIPRATPYVRQALAELLAGKPVSQPSTRPYGCTIKYKSAA